MADNRQVDIVLKWIADQQAANRAGDGIKKLNSDLASVGKTSDVVSQRIANISREARIDKIGESFGKMAVKIKDTDKAAAALAKRLQQIGASESEVERATSAFANAGGVDAGRPMLSSTLRTLGREGRALPALNIPGAGGLSTDAIAKVVATLGSLPPVALPVIGVLTALGAGFVALESQLSGVKNALNDAVNANKVYYDAIAQGTSTEDARKRLADLQREQKAQQEELATITTATSQAFKDAVNTYGDAGARLLFGLGNVSSADDELAKRQDELQKSIATNSTEQEGLNRALQDGTLASNDYRKALEEEAKIKSDAALAGAQDEYNLQLRKQQEQLMTSAQLMSKVVDLNQQSTAAEAALVQLKQDKARGVGGVDIDKQITAFELQIARAGGDITRLMALYENRKGVEDAIQKEKDLAAARKNVDKINDDLNKAIEKHTEDIAAAQQKYQQSLDDLKSAFENANLEAEIERQQKLADLQTENRDKEIETTQKYNDDRIKIEEDYQKRVKEIEREFTRSSAQAIQDRDAVALDAAEQKRKDELDDAKTSRDEKYTEREREYRQELRQLQRSNIDKINEINRDFQREAEQRARKYAYDQQQLAINNQREIAQRQAAYERQLADLRKNLTANADLWAQAGQTIVNYAKSVVNSINNLMGGGTSFVGNAVSSNGGSSALGGAFSFANGGLITRSGLVNAHAGEVILNRKQQAQSMGGFNFAPVINGVNKFEIKRQVNIELDKVLTEAGM